MYRTRIFHASRPRTDSEKHGYNVLPEKNSAFRFDSRITVLHGEKARSAGQARHIAASKYPVYCQQIGRGVFHHERCNDQSALEAVIARMDWKSNHLVIRPAYDVSVGGRPRGGKERHPISGDHSTAVFRAA